MQAGSHPAGNGNLILANSRVSLRCQPVDRQVLRCASQSTIPPRQTKQQWEPLSALGKSFARAKGSGLPRARVPCFWKPCMGCRQCVWLHRNIPSETPQSYSPGQPTTACQRYAAACKDPSKSHSRALAMDLSSASRMQTPAIPPASLTKMELASTLLQTQLGGRMVWGPSILPLPLCA